MEPPNLPTLVQESTYKPRWRLRLALGVSLALVLVVALVNFVYIASARRAISAYWQRLSNSTSLSFQSNLNFTGSDFLKPLDTSLGLTGNLNHSNSLAAAATFSGLWMGKNYTGDSVIDNGRLFAKLSGSSPPVIRYKQSSFLVPLQPGVWYGAKFDQSLFDNICENRVSSSNQAKLDLYRNLRQTKVQPSWWVNFWASNAGRRATHLSGSIPNAQLPQLLTSLQNALPPGCGLNTLGFSPSDSARWKVHYDLYLQSQHDTAKVIIDDKSLGAHTVITLDTFAYNQPLTITAPAGAVDLNQLYGHAPPPY